MNDASNSQPFLPFARPDIGEEEISAVVECMRSGWLTTGGLAREFESRFASRVGAGHALAVNSATAGLHLALEAVGLAAGQRVLTTPYTFTASAEVIRYLGADPVFVDIEPDTFNIDPVGVERALDVHQDVAAILPVHFAGQACEMTPLLRMARERGIAIIEDAAHAFPTTYEGRMIGTLGRASVFSFYATKTICTGEGGMVTTDDEQLAARIRVMRLHGINRDVFDRYRSTRPAWYYEVIAPGFKYNLTDIAAAIGLVQLQRTDQMLARRTAIARAYTEAFGDLPLRVPRVRRENDVHAWHLYVLQLDLEALDIDRDRFIEIMAERGIGTSVHFIPLHIQPYWRDRYGLRPEDFPVSHDVYRRSVSLPIYSAMSDADVSRVIEAVRSTLAGHAA